MARRSSPTLLLESLERRLCMSANLPVAQAAGPDTTRLYRYDALTATQGNTHAATYGNTYTNTSFTDAQKFFNRFKNNFITPSPFPTPTPAPTPTPTPDPSPAPAPTNSNPCTITQQTRGNLTRLVITGTSGDDSIVVSQSGNTLTIVDNGHTDTVSGTFGELAIYGAAGNDTITVQSSVNISTLLYGGDGNNTLIAAGSAQSYIITIGSNGSNTVTGNGLNTAYWVNPADTVNASGAESAAGDIHRVSSFYGNVSTSLAGQNLADPTDSGSTTNLSSGSLFGTGPGIADVHQGQVGDCYFLASIDAFAADLPARLQQMAVDLGDGTYAVQFKRAGVTTFVRVDGDMPLAPWGGLLYNKPAANGPIWACVLEKAYAFFRTGANTYASLNMGWTGSAYSDLGVANNTFSTYGNLSSLYNTLSSALSGSKAVSIITNGSITGGAPLIGNHAYAILAAYTDPNGAQWLTLRNPWGFDGAGSDSNYYDGIVTISVAQLQANSYYGSISV